METTIHTIVEKPAEWIRAGTAGCASRRRFPLDAVVPAAILTLLIANIAVMMSYHSRQTPTYDFLAFYTAGRIVNEVGPSKLYDFDTQRKLHSQIEPHADQRPLWAYLNPPFVALLLSPLAALSYQRAYVLMALINLFLFICAMRVTTHGLSRQMKIACTLGAVATVPAYYAFYNGQLVCLLMLLFALLMEDLRQGRDRRAGVWLALLLIKPQLLIVPLLLLVWKRRFRTLLAAAPVAALLAIVSLAMIGPAGARQYFQVARMAVANNKSVAFFAHTMHNWRGFFLRANIGEWTGPATLIACAATLGLLFWIWRDQWRPTAPQLMALVPAALLVSPHCHDHDFVLFGIVLALLARLVKKGSTMWLAAAGIALATWASPWLPNGVSCLHSMAAASLIVIALHILRLPGRVSSSPLARQVTQIPVREIR